MKKVKKVLFVVGSVAAVLLIFMAVTTALDLREMRRNKDEDYDFAEGPGEDIPEPPAEDDFDTVVEWDDEDQEPAEVTSKGPAKETVTYTIDPDRINVLLVGVDKRPGSKRAPLSDSIMIFSYKEGADPVLMSIPRDTYVHIPGRGMDKINHSHGFGGITLLRQAVENFTKIPIHYYLRVNFGGFEGIVDMLGGVEIYVEKNILHLKQGTQVLNGADALTFCRFRYDSRGDFGRADRQQRFLMAIVRQVQRESLHKLPALIKEGVKYLDTDMPLLRLLDFADRFSGMDPDTVARHVVVGKGFYYKGTYYSQPRVAAMQEFIIKYMTAQGQTANN